MIHSASMSHDTLRNDPNVTYSCSAHHQVEDILREKITENWKFLSAGLVKSDQQDTGMVYPKTLRRIVEKFTLPISDEHFEK